MPLVGASNRDCQMDEGQFEFNRRLRLLDRKHRALERGYATHIRADGLIVARPRGERRRIALKPLILCIGCFFLFKAFLVAQLGATVYAERVARLERGTPVEQAGGWIMQPDPLSEMIAGQIAAIMR